MDTKVLIAGSTSESVWLQIEKDFKKTEPLEYQAVIEMGGKKTSLNIDIDLGGGFEGGYAVTTFSSLLQHNKDFRFAIHREDFIDEIGKFFGMQDVVIGYPEFDNKEIIKTNNPEKVRQLFSDSSVREVFQSFETFTFGIAYHHAAAADDVKAPFLELVIEEAITDTSELKRIFTAFYKVLQSLDE